MTETTHLDAIRRDLTKVADQAHWAWGLMWENPGRGLDAEHGTVHKPPSSEPKAPATSPSSPRWMHTRALRHSPEAPGAPPGVRRGSSTRNGTGGA